jgi:hypothetical protein
MVDTKAKGYIQPKLYQAMYNPMTRAIEAELASALPIILKMANAVRLGKFCIRLVVFNHGTK